MHSFILHLKNNFVVTVKGNNMIDACLRAGEGIDYKSVVSYQENNGHLVQFAK